MRGLFTLLLYPTLFIIFVGGSLIWALYQRKNGMRDILLGKDVLARWTYSPEEWRTLAAGEFEWVRHVETPGQIYISPYAILIYNGRDRFFADLQSNGALVTKAVVRGTNPPVFKLRTRWKQTVYSNSGKKVNYFSNDFHVPVPSGREEEAARLVEYFDAQAEKNADAIQDVMPEEGGLSILGKEPFDL